MSDITTLIIVLLLVGVVALIYRARSVYVAGLFVLFYWSFWLIPLYLSSEGYNKPDLYALALVLSFIGGYTFFFSIGFGHSVTQARQFHRQNVPFGRHLSPVHPVFIGRVYQAHLFVILGATLLLAIWTAPFLGSFFSGDLDRGAMFSNDETTNPIFNTPLRRFIYFRLLMGFYMYFYVYCLIAALCKRSAVPAVLMLFFSLFYSASTLSRSSLANLFLLVVILYFLFSTVQDRSVWMQLRAFFSGKRLVYIVLMLGVTVLGMVLVSFNRIGGLSLIDAYHYLIDAIAGYGVLGYASLATDLHQFNTPLQTHLSYGSSFIEGLTQPIASVGRRIVGPDFYYLLQRYEMTANYRDAFNLVGIGVNRELTANVHYSSVYAAYVDARFIGPALFGSIWGFFSGFYCKQWCIRKCPFSLGMGALLIYFACMSCHVHPADRESFWFPIVILCFFSYYYRKKAMRI